MFILMKKLNAVKKALAEIKPELDEQFGVSEIGLFGVWRWCDAWKSSAKPSNTCPKKYDFSTLKYPGNKLPA
jgi:hypothetical protein